MSSTSANKTTCETIENSAASCHKDRITYFTFIADWYMIIVLVLLVWLVITGNICNVMHVSLPGVVIIKTKLVLNVIDDKHVNFITYMAYFRTWHPLWRSLPGCQCLYIWMHPKKGAVVARQILTVWVQNWTDFNCMSQVTLTTSIINHIVHPPLQ